MSTTVQVTSDWLKEVVPETLSWEELKDEAKVYARHAVGEQLCPYLGPEETLLRVIGEDWESKFYVGGEYSCEEVDLATKVSLSRIFARQPIIEGEYINKLISENNCRRKYKNLPDGVTVNIPIEDYKELIK